MNGKKILALGLVLISFGAHAIPPAPPSTIYNKIRSIAARNCITENGIVVGDLKDTENVKFVLQLNKNASAGLLTILENGEVSDNLKVTCK